MSTNPGNSAITNGTPICAQLTAQWFDPAAGGRVLINPDGPEAADTITELLDAAEGLLSARRSGPPNKVTGHHPVSGHPLNAEGVAAVKLETAISKARSGQ